MMLLLRWAVNAAGLLLVAYLYPGVMVESFLAAMVAALALGLINAVVRPLLVFLTLPITILTLGLFLLVLNALLFWVVAETVPGFRVTGFVAALIGSFFYSVITVITSKVLGSRKK